MNLKPSQGNAYRRESDRVHRLDTLHKESLTLLMILYGLKFDEGDIQVRNFYKMTMPEIHREFQIRTMMLKSRKLYIEKRLSKTEQQDYDAAIEELKMFSG